MMRSTTIMSALRTLIVSLCFQSFLAGAAWAAGSVGVVPFEHKGPAGAVIPNVASPLALRLGASGLDRVVGPEALNARRTAMPSEVEIEAWSQASAVEYLVVGRVTRFGNALSIDARLLDSTTALSVGEPVVVEVLKPADLASALDEVARQLASLVLGNRTEGKAAEDQGREKKTSPDADQPIEITSDELSFQPNPGGGRTMDFEGHVKIVKGALVVTADVARASYPPGESTPDEIAARGHVVIRQEGKTAYCERADFDQVANQMVCKGNLATLEQGCDRVRGRKITFSLGTEELQVEGDVTVKRMPGCEGSG